MDSESTEKSSPKSSESTDFTMKSSPKTPPTPTSDPFAMSLNVIKKLDSSNIRLTQICHTVFKDHRHLEEIDLSNNQIERMCTHSFVDLGLALKSLNLSSNRLGTIDATTFDSLRLLEKLNLSNNRIEQIAPNAFIHLKRLAELKLYMNRLVSIDSKTFLGLENLEILDLTRNRIRQIDSDSFGDLKNMRELYLSDNQLEHVDSKWFSSFSNIALIDLHNNKFNSPVNSYFCEAIFPSDQEMKYLNIMPEDFIKELNESDGYLSEKPLFLRQFTGQFDGFVFLHIIYQINNLTFVMFFKEKYEIMSPLEGKQIGNKYTVEKLLGKGGFGPVYVVSEQKIDNEMLDNLFILKLCFFSREKSFDPNI